MYVCMYVCCMSCMYVCHVPVQYMYLMYVCIYVFDVCMYVCMYSICIEYIIINSNKSQTTIVSACYYVDTIVYLQYRYCTGILYEIIQQYFTVLTKYYVPVRTYSSMIYSTVFVPSQHKSTESRSFPFVTISVVFCLLSFVLKRLL